MSNALLGNPNSIPAQVYVPQTQNMYQQVGQIAQTQNALLGLQQNQMQLQARQALGQAYQQATDPNSGQIDQNKLMGMISQGPAAYMLGDIQQRNLANIHSQLENQGISLDQAMKKVNYGRGVYASLLADPNSTPQDVLAAAGQSVADGIQSPQEATQHLLTMPTQNGPQFRQWLQQQQLQLMSAQERFNAINGTSTTINTGGAQQPGVQASPMMGGGFTPGGQAVPNTLTPAQAASPVAGPIGPGGAPTTIPLGNYAAQNGMGNLMQGGAAPTIQPSGLGTGRYPGLPAGLYNPANQQPATASPMVTGLGPGQSATLAANASAGAAQGNALGALAAESPNRLAALSQLEQESAGFTGGVGAAQTLALKSAYNRFAPQIASYDPKGQSAQEAFNKTAQMIINQQSQALGAGSDARLDAAAHANLSENISNAGVHEILPILKGNELAIQARNQAWQSARAQSPTADYQQWSTQFNQTFDPRLYQAQFMTPAQRQAMVSNLSGPDKAHFVAALRAHPELMAPATSAAPPAYNVDPGPNGA